MKKKTLFIATAAIILLLALSGCVPGDGAVTPDKPAGFLWGIWHGWIAPVSLIISLFDKNVSIYEVHNNGWWYNFGYYIAIISGFGGLSIFRGAKHKNRTES